MFCDRCGYSLRETDRFCGNCGKTIRGGPPPGMGMPRAASIAGGILRRIKLFALENERRRLERRLRQLEQKISSLS